MFEAENHIASIHQEDYQDIKEKEEEKKAEDIEYEEKLSNKKRRKKKKLNPKSKIKQLSPSECPNVPNRYSDTEDDDDNENEEDEDYDIKTISIKNNTHYKLAKQKNNNNHNCRQQKKIINKIINITNKKIVLKAKATHNKLTNNHIIDKIMPHNQTEVISSKKFDIANSGNDVDSNNRNDKNYSKPNYKIVIPVIQKDNKGNNKSGSINKLLKKFNPKVSIPLANSSLQVNMLFLEASSQNSDKAVDIVTIPFDDPNQSQVNVNINDDDNITQNNSNVNALNNHHFIQLNENNNVNDINNPSIQINKDIEQKNERTLSIPPQLKPIVSSSKGNLLSNNQNYFNFLKNTSNHPLLQSPFHYKSPSFRKSNLTHAVHNPLSYQYYHPNMNKFKTQQQFNEYDSKYYNSGNYFQYPQFNEPEDLLSNKRYRDDIYTNLSPFHPDLYTSSHFFSEYSSIGNNYRRNISPLPPPHFNLMEDNIIPTSGNNNTITNTPNHQNLNMESNHNTNEDNNTKNKDKVGLGNNIPCNGNCNCNKHSQT